jgi:hypothetical protein
MLINPMWYPSHALLLAAFTCYATVIITIRRHGSLRRGHTKVLTVVAVIAVAAAFAMLPHLFAATNADAIAAGETNFRYHIQQIAETVFDALWGLSIATFAVIGGLTRTVGNRITAVLGLAGGIAFALASATIAFTDLFDQLFMLGSLIGIWGLTAGTMLLTHRPAKAVADRPK